MNNISIIGIGLLESFFASWLLIRAGGLSTRSILGPLLFVIIAVFFITCMQKITNSKRTSLIVCILSLIFTILYLAADSSTLVEGLNNRFFQLIILAACFAGLFFLFFHSLSLLFFYGEQYILKSEEKAIKKLPLIGFFLCLLAWLPYFLYEYPGVMTPDSINQLEQVIGMVPYGNHHPWSHTMVLSLFYHIGRIFTDNVSIAISFFTVFQMMFMAFCIAFLISTLQKFKIKNIFLFLVLAFYAFVPYHAVFAVTIWKDVMFSGAVLLFTVSLLRLLFLHDCLFSHKKTRIITLALYILSGIMLSLFRTNGWYAFLISLPFLLFAFRHEWKLMFPIHLAILVFALLIKGPVMTSFHVTQPDFVESICIPLQQVARVICEDKELTSAQWESVHKVIDTTYIKDLYSPGFADNMKELVRAGNPDYLTEHKAEYFKLWLSLGLRYPSVYLSAYIDQTKGYWYPDVPYAVAEIDGIIQNETGAVSHPLIGGPVIVKAKEIFLKLGDMMPLYGLLFSMGAMFWVLLCMIFLITAKKQYLKYILYIPGVAIIFTLFLATPVSSEFRYAYSLAYALPLYLFIPFMSVDSSKSTK